MKKIISISMFLIILLGLFITCWGAEKQAGGVMKIIYASYPQGPLGLKSDYNRAFQYMLPAVETLLTYEDGSGIVKPKLATDVKLSPDSKSIILTIRKGVKFHDGSDLDGSVVKWNLDILQTSRTKLDMITSIDLVDPYTVKINLSDYNNTIIPQLCYQWGAILSKAAYEKNGEEWVKKNPIGTGPFKFKSAETDIKIKFEKFADYWQQGKPSLDGIECIFIKEPMVVSASLQAGEADAAWGSTVVTLKMADELKQKGFNIFSYPSGVHALAGDSIHPNSYFANKKVREAVSHAINNTSIAKTLGYGMWQPLTQWCPPENAMGYNPNIKGREYSPQKAKQLLAEAGYPNGFKCKLVATPYFTTQDAVTALQSNLKDVGIDAEIALSHETWVTFSTKGHSDNSLCVVTTSNEPHFLRTLTVNMPMVQAQYYPGVARPEGWKEAMANGLKEQEFKGQQEKTRLLMKMLDEDATLTPLWTTPTLGVQKASLNTDLNKYHFYMWHPEDAWLKK